MMKLSVGIFLILGVWLGYALAFMLLVGDVHRLWWSAVPLVSYHAALVLCGVATAAILTAGFISGLVKEYYK